MFNLSMKKIPGFKLNEIRMYSKIKGGMNEWMDEWMRGYKRGEKRGKNKNRKHVKIQILWKHIDFKRNDEWERTASRTKIPYDFFTH